MRILRGFLAFLIGSNLGVALASGIHVIFGVVAFQSFNGWLGWASPVVIASYGLLSGIWFLVLRILGRRLNELCRGDITAYGTLCGVSVITAVTVFTMFPAIWWLAVIPLAFAGLCVRLATGSAGDVKSVPTSLLKGNQHDQQQR